MTGRRTTSVVQAFRPAFPAFLALVFGIKLIVLLQLHDHPLLQPQAGLDTAAYLHLAQQVRDGNLALGPGLYFVSPFYIYFLALILAIAGDLFWVRLVQIALGTAAVWLVFRTAALWHGRRAAWAAGTLAAVTGLFTFYEILMLQAAVDPFLTALTLFLLTRALTGTSDATFALPGLAFGLHSLNRPNVLVAAIAVAVLVAIVRRGRAGLLLAAGVFAALLPLTIRNAAVAGDLSPVASHGGLNFYIGNHAEADGTYRMVEGITPNIAGQQQDARRVAEAAAGGPLTDAEVSAYFYGRGLAWIADHPGDSLRLFVKKLAYVFNAAHLSLNYSYRYYSGDEATLLRWLIAGPWLLVPLGLLGVWLGCPRDPGLRRGFIVWSGFVVAYAGSVALFFVAERYRLPILIPLCVSSGAAIASLPTLSARRGIVAVAVLAVLAGATNWRFGLDEGLAEERTRHALWLIDQGRFVEADTRVARAEPDHPQRGLLHLRVGRALIAKGQQNAGLAQLRKAKEADPQQPEIDYALGTALMAAGRPQDAIPYLRAAVDAGVRVDISGFDLARALAAAGDRAGAIAVLARVSPRDADDAQSWHVMGKLALDLRELPLAERFSRQAVAANPRFSAAHQQLGLVLAMLGRIDEGIRALEEAVRLDARDATAHLNLAVAYAQAGRIADARTHAEAALAIDPNYERARGLGQALRRN